MDRTSTSSGTLPRCLFLLVLCLCMMAPALAGYQPDFSYYIDGTSIGDSIYSPDGTAQTSDKSEIPGGEIQYYYMLKNNGTASDAFRINGPKSGDGWTIRYWVDQLGEVTSYVADAGYTTVSIAPGEWTTFCIDVLPDASLSEGMTREMLVTATSIADPSKCDAVLARAHLLHVSDYKPDLMVKLAGEPSYAGEHLYTGHTYTATNDQQKRNYTPFDSSHPVVIQIKVQNNGKYDDQIKVTSGLHTDTRPSWNMICTWYDAPTGGNDITAQFDQNQGYLSPMLAPGQSTELRVEISTTIVDTTLIGCGAGISAISSHTDPPDNCLTDRFGIQLGQQYLPLTIQPDLLIRPATATYYTGDIIYNHDGVDQTTNYALSPRQTATYFVKLQNDLVDSGPYYVTGDAGTNGWAVHYFDAAYGGNDITNAITHDGWSCGRLNETFSTTPGFREIRVEVTAPTDAEAGEQALTLSLFSAYDPTKFDVVKAITTLEYPRCPDLWIRAAGETASVGDNIFNVLAEQTKSQPLDAGQAAEYVVTVQNDSVGPDHMTLTGDDGGNGWTVQYFAGTEEITTAITGVGWTTPVLPAGETLPIHVVVAADNSQPVGARKEVVVNVASALDATATDAVKAVTTRAALSVVTLGAIPTAPRLVHTPITLTATPTGGGAVEYQFRCGYQDAAGWHWSVLRDYGATATCAWKPDTARLYTLLVYAREVSSAKAYDVLATISYRILLPISSINVSVTPHTPQVLGTPITITATPTGGANLEYLFKAGYQDAAGWHWSVIRDYAPTATCVWTATVPHLYTLLVYAREQGSTAAYQKYATFDYRISAPPITATTLTALPAAPQKINTPIALTAQATGGYAVEYKFRVGYQDVTGWHWTELTGYGAGNSTWTPATAHSYSLVVYAREVGSTVGYNVYKTVSYLVTAR